MTTIRPAHFSGIPASPSPAPRFGAEQPNPSNPREGSQLQSDLGVTQRIRNLTSAYKNGVGSFLSTIMHGPEINSALKQASPKSSSEDRLLALFQIAMSKGLQQFASAISPYLQDAQAQKQEQELKSFYSEVFKDFPRLVLNDTPLIKDFTEQTLGKDDLKEIRERFKNDDTLDLDKLRSALIQKLKPKKPADTRPAEAKDDPPKDPPLSQEE